MDHIHSNAERLRNSGRILYNRFGVDHLRSTALSVSRSTHRRLLSLERPHHFYNLVCSKPSIKIMYGQDSQRKVVLCGCLVTRRDGISPF